MKIPTIFISHTAIEVKVCKLNENELYKRITHINTCFTWHALLSKKYFTPF